MGETANTEWSVIRGAAAGGGPDRDEFARRYSPVIRAYLGARWRQSPLIAETEDAAQDVFLECFRANGPLTRADSQFPGGFRAYLYGVVRNVARRIEKAKSHRRERQPGSDFDMTEVEGHEDPVSGVFDRAWALALLRRAAEIQALHAEEDGSRARRRLDLLRLRFVEDRPIREIARDWGEATDRVHYEYLRARDDFKAALREVVRTHDPACSVEKECARILQHLAV